MSEIINVYKQDMGATKFIGIKYNNANRINGKFEVKPKWNEWFQNGWFESIQMKINKNPNDTFISDSFFIGLLRNKPGEPFQYWIGMFTPEKTEIPEGFTFINFPKSELIVCQIYGSIEHVYLNKSIDIFNQCNERLKKEGLNHVHDKNDVCYTFERYESKKSIIPDEKGNIILEICFFANFYY